MSLYFCFFLFCGCRVLVFLFFCFCLFWVFRYLGFYQQFGYWNYRMQNYRVIEGKVRRQFLVFVSLKWVNSFSIVILYFIFGFKLDFDRVLEEWYFRVFVFSLVFLGYYGRCYVNDFFLVFFNGGQDRQVVGFWCVLRDRFVLQVCYLGF